MESEVLWKGQPGARTGRSSPSPIAAGLGHVPSMVRPWRPLLPLSQPPLRLWGQNQTHAAPPETLPPHPPAPDTVPPRAGEIPAGIGAAFPSRTL